MSYVKKFYAKNLRDKYILHSLGSGQLSYILGVIVWGDRKFVSYRVNGENYLEEVVVSESTPEDLFTNEEWRVVKIEDDRLWKALYHIAEKEGFFTGLGLGKSKEEIADASPEDQEAFLSGKDGDGRDLKDDGSPA